MYHPYTIISAGFRPQATVILRPQLYKFEAPLYRLVKQLLCNAGYNNAVTTHANSRRQKELSQAQVPLVPTDPVVASDPPVSVPRRRQRKDHHDENVQRMLEPWTPDFLADKQSEDANLCKIRQWIIMDNKLNWDNNRGESPTLKADRKSVV